MHNKRCVMNSDLPMKRRNYKFLHLQMPKEPGSGWQNDTKICFFGCKFATKYVRVYAQHLIDEHTDGDLEPWGICKAALRMQIKIYDEPEFHRNRRKGKKTKVEGMDVTAEEEYLDMLEDEEEEDEFIQPADFFMPKN
jgi:hypothetical protein